MRGRSSRWAVGRSPGCCIDDPEDPVEWSRHARPLRSSRPLGAPSVLKAVPAGREEDAFAADSFPDREGGPVFVHFRLFSSFRPTGASYVLWHSSGAARTVASRPLVADRRSPTRRGCWPKAGHRLYAERAYRTRRCGREATGSPSSATSRPCASPCASTRGSPRSRWTGHALGPRRPARFPSRSSRCSCGRAGWTRHGPDHDAALAVRLRPFLDQALRLADAWVGEIARRMPSADAALAVVGDRGLGRRRSGW